MLIQWNLFNPTCNGRLILCKNRQNVGWNSANNIENGNENQCGITVKRITWVSDYTGFTVLTVNHPCPVLMCWSHLLIFFPSVISSLRELMHDLTVSSYKSRIQYWCVWVTCWFFSPLLLARWGSWCMIWLSPPTRVESSTDVFE